MSNFIPFPSPQSAIKAMVVASGGDPKKDGDFPQDKSSSMKLVNPLEHGEGVSLQDLPFSPMFVPPTSQGQTTYMGGLDPGTMVYVLKGTGSSGGIILGMANSILKGFSEGNGGGQDLTQTHVQDLRSRKTGVSVPPEIEETEERGVKVRKIKEKNEQHSHDLLEGLPVHGALFDMSGFRLPEITNVPTAKQTNDGMISQDMLQGLTGQIMSLGQMFKGLKGNKGGGGGGGGVPTSTNTATANASRWNSIQSTVPQNVQLALGNLSTLVQGMEVSEGVAFLTGNVVHEETYLENAANLFKQCETIDDVMYCLNRLQWDTSLFGTDKLTPAQFSVNTAFGLATQRLSYDGELTTVYSSSANSAIRAFANTISSNTSSPGIGSSPSSGSGGNAGGSNNMFGNSAQTIMDMLKRLPQTGEQSATQMHQTLNTNQSSSKLFDIVKQTLNGGNPLEKGLYQ